MAAGGGLQGIQLGLQYVFFGTVYRISAQAQPACWTQSAPTQGRQAAEDWWIASMALVNEVMDLQGIVAAMTDVPTA